MRPDRRRCLTAALFGGWNLAAPAQPGAETAAASAVRRQLRFTMSLSNPLAEELRDQSVWVYVPASDTPTQQLVDLRVSMEHEVLSDSLGHRIVKLRLATLPALATRVVTIVADVALHEEPVQTAVAVSPVPWLETEHHIETSNPGIRALAFELRHPSERDTARAIFDWVRGNLHYAGYIADDMGALYALKERRGDCTEYAYLAVALARVNGIPARMVGGYVADRNMAPRAEEYHNWAELFFNGAWRLVDAQKEHWLSPANQYIAFRFYRDQEINPVGLAHRFRVEGRMQARL
jgi:transglutaminase-like putative cysteine protease